MASSDREPVSPLFEPLEPRLYLSATLRGSTLRIEGTPGDDRISLSAADPGQVVVEGVDGVADGTTFHGVRKIRVRGGDGHDQIRLSHDLVDANGRFISSRIRGGDGNDRITGGSGRDRIKGQDGNDRIEGGAGDDRLSGGRDDDELIGGAGNDRVSGNSGEDILEGNEGNDRIKGGRGDDRIDGGRGANRMSGGHGDDVFLSRSDFDRIRRSRRDHVISGDGGKSLRRLESEGALRQWLMGLGLEQWDALTDHRPLPINWLRQGRTEFVAVEGLPLTAASSDVTDFSGTNIQVEGVDEADIIKTDGEHLYLLADGELVIVDARPDDLRVTARVEMDGATRSLYLHEDRVTVLADVFESSFVLDPGLPQLIDQALMLPQFDQKVKITVLDVSNRSEPLVTREIEFDGSLISSRAVNEHVYLVLQNSFDLIRPLRLDHKGGEPRMETRVEYRRRLADMPLDDILPGFNSQIRGPDGGETVSGSLVEAPRIYSPRVPVNQAMTTVVAIDVLSDAVPQSTTIVGVAGDVYAAPQSLYIVSVGRWTPWGDQLHSTAYKFTLDDSEVKLAATGRVPGHVLNQFSMDEHNGFFRIATTQPGAAPTNGVYILEQNGDELEIAGSLEGLAPNETIRSARFLGERGFLVTFRNIDPLFTLDLSDPRAPRAVAELKITGFSTYLHPLGESHLIGFGHEANPQTGRVDGMKLSLFDVTDFEHPELADAFRFEVDVPLNSIALSNHHAFSFFPEHDILALPIRQDFRWISIDPPEVGLVVFEVTTENGFDLLGWIEYEDPVLRSLRIGHRLYSVSATEIQVHEIDDPDALLAELNLDEDAAEEETEEDNEDPDDDSVIANRLKK